MRWLFVLKEAFEYLLANSGRYFLIVIALSLAVGSFNFAISLRRGLASAIKVAQLDAPRGFKIYDVYEGMKGEALRGRLTKRDLDSLQDVLNGRAVVSGFAVVRATCSYEGRSQRCLLTASFPVYRKVGDMVVSGTLLSEEDERDRRMVACPNTYLLKRLSINPG